ncbi:MAG: hypothetical protein HY909_17935 [Deltaproteobacteria bacterium]|nr:hypothetical protein [Deltaproteobacteria bacterium]
MIPPEVIGLGDRGLDLILGGGARLVERVPGRSGAAILLRGPAGSGKTLVGLHIALALARAGQGSVAYGCVELLPSELEAQLSAFPNLASAARVVHGPAPGTAGEAETTLIHARLLDLHGGIDTLGEAVQRLCDEITVEGVPPRALVIDSLSDGYGLGAKVSREFADAVCKLTAHLGFSIVLLEECASETPSPWVFAADTVLELGHVLEDADATRSSPFERRLMVAKHRFGPSDLGPHRFSLDPVAGLQVYPRPSAWLEPWAGSLAAGVGDMLDGDPLPLRLPLRGSREVEGFVVAVHGPDLQRVFGLAMGVFPRTRGSTPQSAEFHVDLSLPLGWREDAVGVDGLHRTLGLAQPYLSPHRMLRFLLDEVRDAPPLWRIVLGDFQALRSFLDEESLRRSLVSFILLMRRRRTLVVLYESKASRIASGLASSVPSLGPGFSVAKVIDMADISMENMSDRFGRFSTIDEIILTWRSHGIVEQVKPVPLNSTDGSLRLRERFRAMALCVPQSLLDRAIVFGDSALALHGLDLARELTILECSIDDDTFNALQATQGFMRHERPTAASPFLTLARRTDIEFRAPFSGVDFDTVAAGAAPMMGSFGLKVASLQDLRKWKQAQLDQSSHGDLRDRHQRDLKQIDAVLNRR